MSWLQPRAHGVVTGVVVALLGGGASLSLGGIVPALARAALSAKVELLREAPSSPLLPEHDVGVPHLRASNSAPRENPLLVDRCEDLVLTIVSEHENDRDSLATFRTPQGSVTRGFGGAVGAARVVYVGTDPLRRRPTAWLLRDRALCRAAMFEAATVAPERNVGGPETAAPRHAGIERLDATHFRVDRAVAADLLQGPERLGVVAGPSRDGFVVRRVRPGSVGQALGLESGDRVVSVNGIAPSDVEGLMRVAAALPRTPGLRVVLQRGAARVALDYRIE